MNTNTIIVTCPNCNHYNGVELTDKEIQRITTINCEIKSCRSKFSFIVQSVRASRMGLGFVLCK